MFIIFFDTVELSDVKGQLKILQEQNTNYMQQNMVLEEVRQECNVVMVDLCEKKKVHYKLANTVPFHIL